MMSHKTAIARTKLSRPAQFFKPYLIGDTLDFGCGRGTDADFLGADKYDPHFFPNSIMKLYQSVMLIYVLNVVVKPRNTLLHAASVVKPGGLLMVATRTVKEVNDAAKRGKWKESNYGWVTGRGTLQHGMCIADITKMLPRWELVESKGSPFTGVILRRPT